MVSAAATEATGGQAWARRAMLLCVLLSVALAWHGARRQSLTWDEPVFIVAGLSYWQTGDFRLNSEAPPVAQTLVAMPLLALDLAPPRYDSPAFAADRQVEFAIDFMRANASRLADIAFWSRLPVWLLTAFGVWLAGHWAWALLGPRGAALAAALVTFTPTLVAHGRLATTDQACAVAMLAAGYCLWRALREDALAWWLAWGAAAALASGAKYTGLLLLPIGIAQIAVTLLIDRRLPRRCLPGLALAALVALGLVGAFYARPFDPRPFLAGLARLYTNTDPRYHSYLLGTVHERAVWYAYLVAFLLKTPLPSLLLLGGALLRVTRAPRGGELALWLLLPAVAMMGVACCDTVNVGLRRVLPALAPLGLFSALLVGSQSSARGRALVGALVVWLALEVAWLHPHELTYFNQLGGGPARAPWLLDDSNIDWGQDLPGLADWQAAYAVGEPLKLAYFGTMPPELYGVRATPMEEADYRDPAPGLYALSTHRLVWLRKIEAFTHAGVDWLTRYRPVARIGYAIYVYRFPGSRAAAR